jgi:hypothetical protein
VRALKCIGWMYKLGWMYKPFALYHPNIGSAVRREISLTLMTMPYER